MDLRRISSARAVIGLFHSRPDLLFIVWCCEGKGHGDSVWKRNSGTDEVRPTFSS